MPPRTTQWMLIFNQALLFFALNLYRASTKCIIRFPGLNPHCPISLSQGLIKVCGVSLCIHATQEMKKGGQSGTSFV